MEQFNFSDPLIYIIEDTEEINDLLAMLLEKENFRYKQFLNAEEAHEEIIDKGERPNLILLDLMLPGMDGLEFCTSIKTWRDTNSIRIVMLTAKATQTDRRQGISVGADQYLFKPFEHEEVLANVKQELKLQEELSKGAFQKTLSFTFGSDELYIKEINKMMAKLLVDTPISEEQLFELKYFIQELGKNAVEWGNKFDLDKQVNLTCKITEKAIELIVRDEGSGFSFDSFLDKKFDIMAAVANLSIRRAEGKRTGGFGIISIKNMASRIDYNEEGNEVRIYKEYSQDSPEKKEEAAGEK
ncbi:response regulator [Candidatus Riflebacteria bacterium]